jgi:hypothetical protein
MPLGVIQPRDGKAPGTVILIDNKSQSAAFNFKHAAGKVYNGEEILLEQHVDLQGRSQMSFWCLSPRMIQTTL